MLGAALASEDYTAEEPGTTRAWDAVAAAVVEMWAPSASRPVPISWNSIGGGQIFSLDEDFPDLTGALCVSSAEGPEEGDYELIYRTLEWRDLVRAAPHLPPPPSRPGRSYASLFNITYELEGGQSEAINQE